MQNMSVSEKNKIFKAASEQLEARLLAAGVDKPNESLIKHVFRSLDVEAIAPVYFEKLIKEAERIREDHRSVNISVRVKARERLRKSKDLRGWKASREAGVMVEVEKLMSSFKIAKGAIQ